MMLKRVFATLCLCDISLICIAGAGTAIVSGCEQQLPPETARPGTPEQPQQQAGPEIKEYRILARPEIKERIVDDRSGSRSEMGDIIAELVRLIPENVSITSVNLTEKDVVGQAVDDAAPKAEKGARVEVVIVGLAPSDVDVGTFIGLLATSPVFQDVSLVYSHAVAAGGQEARKFKLGCSVVR
ncbi:MAG: PilN domain-containing protein [Planctomycetota bacterium]